MKSNYIFISGNRITVLNIRKISVFSCDSLIFCQLYSYEFERNRTSGRSFSELIFFEKKKFIHPGKIKRNPFLLEILYSIMETTGNLWKKFSFFFLIWDEDPRNFKYIFSTPWKSSSNPLHGKKLNNPIQDKTKKAYL